MTRTAARAYQAAFFARYPILRNVLELFEYVPHAHFYAKDRQSRFVKVNQAVLDRLGVASELDMVGRDDHAFHPPALAQGYIEEDQRVMSSGRMLPQQAWLVGGRFTQSRWYLSTKTPLMAPDGAVVGLAGVMHPIATPREWEDQFRELTPVIRHLEDQYRERVRVSALAAMAGLSATHFNRRFRQLVGMPPTAYLQALRIQEAQRLLVETREGLGQIAQAVGFYDQSHFTRCFKRSTGIAPLGYRRRFARSD